MKFTWPEIVIIVAALLMVTGITTKAQTAPTHQYWAYIGNTSTDGIGLFKLDADAGTLTPAGIAAPANGPDFLAIAPNQKYLYAGIAIQTPDGKAGGVEGFSIDAATGKLTAINQQPSEGDEAAFVTVDPSGRNALAANYAKATVSVLPIGADGKLLPASCVIHETGSSVDPVRQTQPYAHSVNCDPAGNYAISCDLGADKLFIYKFDADAGKLEPNDPPSVSVPPGSGPRHLTFSPNGKFVYQINEMGATVIAFAFDGSKGTLTEIQSVKLLKNDEKGNTSAEVQVDPSGRFLYASNRLTTNYLTIFSIDAETGKLTLAGYQDSLGKTPRNFRIDPTGRYLLLANQNSDTLVLFSIDQKTGLLSPIGKPVPTVHGPICVKFVAVGN
jgi:6-phosphogluconolactonase